MRVGQYVQPGTRLMTLVPSQDLYVVANFKETQVGLMRPGQPATIRVDALPGVEFTGQVISVTPGTGANFSLIPPQNATGNFTKIVQRVPVRIRIDAGPGGAESAGARTVARSRSRHPRRAGRDRCDPRRAGARRQVSEAIALTGAGLEEQPERASLSDWMAVGAGMLGGLMALVDVSIVNSSLPVIQGEIGATPSEGTWVSTAYLIAEVVIIPLTGWLERLMGMRRLLLGASFMFTLFSMICGMSVSLMTIIVGRIGQGLAGGVLIPTAMTIVARRLPPSQQSIGMAMIAMTALTGPATGPLLGGWLTDTFSWRFIFFLNVPVCAAQILLLVLAFPRDSGDLREFRNADWLGIFGMVVGLGSLTTMLEKGHIEQWFESALIWKLAIAGAIGLLLIAVGQFTSKRPVVRLALLANASLASCVALMTVVGMLLYTTMFIAPQFLVAVVGYNASQAGQVVFIAGIVSIPAAFVYPLLVTRVDTRILVGAAILVLGFSNLMVSSLTADFDRRSFHRGASAVRHRHDAQLDADHAVLHECRAPRRCGGIQQPDVGRSQSWRGGRSGGDRELPGTALRAAPLELRRRHARQRRRSAAPIGGRVCHVRRRARRAGGGLSCDGWPGFGSGDGDDVQRPLSRAGRYCPLVRALGPVPAPVASG